MLPLYSGTDDHTSQFLLQEGEQAMDMIETGKLGGMLRDYRRDAGLTQQDLSEQAGVSARTIRSLELGATQRLHPATIQRLLRATCLGYSHT